MESHPDHERVETKHYTMAELYDLRRVAIKRSRSTPPGPARNEHRQLARWMRSLSKDTAWLAVHTVGDNQNAVTHEVCEGRMIPKRAH